MVCDLMVCVLVIWWLVASGLRLILLLVDLVLLSCGCFCDDFWYLDVCWCSYCC